MSGASQPGDGDASSSPWKLSERAFSLLSIAVIVGVIAIGALPMLTSGDALQVKDDYLASISEYEAVRKSLLEHHQLPLRFHWFGGGYPSLGHPENVALNPLMLLSVALGAVRGVKWIGFLTMAAGGVGAWGLARRVLGYTRWGSLYCGLMVGASLFVPVRLNSGNLNEIYAAFFPLCMLLLGLACRGRKGAILGLSLVIYTMLSDGKLTCAMVVLFLGALCLLNLIPAFRVFGPRRADEEAAGGARARPLKLLIVALTLTFFLGMARILPMADFANAAGGLLNFRYSDHPEMYSDAAGADLAPMCREVEEFLVLVVAGRGWEPSCFSVGWLPVLLFAVALCAAWRECLPWAIIIVLFSWLLLGDHMPVDLYALLRRLPVFNAIRWPDKYFGILICYSFLIVSGRSFGLLAMARPRWLEHVFAPALIALGLSFSLPWMSWFLDVYQYPLPSLPQEEFFQIKGLGLERSREGPFRANQFVNLRRNIGTIDFQTNIYIGEKAIPRYYVDQEGDYLSNPEYRGEAFFLATENWAKAQLHPNSILIDVVVRRPDTLVVNQNFHPGWRSDRGELFSRGGLLALRLRETGRYRIEMRYHLRRFNQGLAVSGLSFVLLLLYCWAYRTRRLPAWARRVIE